MKALILSLFAAGALALSAGDARAADHWRPYHRGYVSHYRPYWGGYRYHRPYYSGYYRPYWRSYSAYPYAYGYPYAYSYYGYPRYGVGYFGPNVSVWYGW